MQETIFTANLTGIDRDTQPELQQDGTYRFALNMRESMDSIAQVENMESNEVCAEIPGTIIGSVYIVDKFILFLAGNGVSEIGYFYPNKCEYSKIDIDCDLNFSVDAPIQAAYKVSIACEDYTIYWTDGINPVRYLDLGNIPTTCKDLELFSCNEIPKIKIKGVVSGGSLSCGSYQFAIRYNDGKGNKSSFFGITNPIPIYADSLEDTQWVYVDGCEGGDITSKAIVLEVTDLDPLYDYIDIAIIYYANGVSINRVLEKQPAKNGLYTINTNGVTDIDVLEIVTPFARWKYADLLVSHQDRLFLGNMQEIKDVEYQKYANNIKVKWFSSKLDINSALKAYKNPLTYDFRTFIADEKYALGIVLEYCNGTYSPVFHIPGPTEEDIECLEFPIYSKINDTGTEDPFIPDLPNIEYNSIFDIVPENDINNFFSCDKYVWEVFNTAGICVEPEDETIIEEDCGIITKTEVGKWHIGHMAYSEECEVYPETLGCDGTPIYPHTVNPDGTFTMSKVRHHRFPSRKLERLFDNADNTIDVDCPFSQASWNIATKNHYIYPLGVEVTDIELPDFLDEVKGYKLVFVKRDDTNKSIIGKGIMHNSFVGKDDVDDSLYTFPRYCVNSSITQSPISYVKLIASISHVKKFHSPDTSFKQNTLLNSSYFAYEDELKGFARIYGVKDKNIDEEDVCAARHNINIIAHGTLSPYQHNSPTKNTTYIENNSILFGVFSRPYYNLINERGVLFDTLNTFTFNNSGYCSHAEINTLVDSYGTVNKYYDASYLYYTEGADNCTQNSIDCISAFYGALKTYKCNQYDNISSLGYIELKTQYIDPNIAALKYSITSFGDGFINYWAYRRQGGAPASQGAFFDCFDSGLADRLPGFPYNALIHTIVESDINIDLRHSETPQDVYYPNMINGTRDIDVQIGYNNTPWDYCYLSEVYATIDNNNFKLDNLGNKFTYNFDFSRLNEQRVYSALPINYNPCDCDSTYKNAIVASEQAFGLVDGWKTFKVNSIISIPKNTGDLKNIVSMRNNLFAHTENNLWQISTSQTKIETNAANIYLGTGDMFASVPQYIYAVPEGFGGIQQKNGFMLNHLGYWFIDAIGADILTLNDGIEVNEKGLTEWLRNNVRFYMLDLIPDYELSATKEIGWLIGLDYKHKLAYITKKDYDLLDHSLYGGVYNETACELGKIYTKDERLLIITDDFDCSYTFLDFNDETYFCNKSWTLSYSFLRKMFRSWHSFIPDTYLYDRYNLFTSKDNTIYKHNVSHNYQTYYGEYYPAIIELVTKSQGTIHWDNAVYMQDAFIYNTQYKKEISVNETFDKAVLYNREQNSGLLELYKVTDYDQDYMQLAIKETVTSVRVVRKNDMWAYNGFADYVVDNTIPHNTCNCIDPIDQVPNTAAIDITKPYYQISPFRGTYIVQRLYIDNPTKVNVKHRLTLFTNNITKTVI